MGTQYVQPSELVSYGANQYALQSVPLTTQTAACITASATLDAYFRGRYPLPFLTYDVDIKMRAAHIATWLLLANRGRDPEAGYDDQINQRYTEAIAWAEAVQRQAIHPNVTISTPSAPTYSFPAVITGCRRGW